MVLSLIPFCFKWRNARLDFIVLVLRRSSRASRDGGPFRGNGGPIAHGVDASVCHWWGLRCAFFHNDSVWSRCWRGQGNEWRLGRMQNLPRGWWWGLHGGPLLLQGQLEGKKIMFQQLFPEEQVSTLLKFSAIWNMLDCRIEQVCSERNKGLPGLN